MTSILVIYRPAGGRYSNQLRGILSATEALGVHPILLVPPGGPPPPRPNVEQHETDLNALDAVRDCVAKLHVDRPIERIFPLFEGDVMVAALCRQNLGIPGLTPDEALNSRDKNVMHRRAAELGLAVARSCRPDTLGAVEGFAATVGFPIVVKPATGWACSGTFRVDTPDDLTDVWRVMSDDRAAYRVEEFIRGIEFHVDSLIHDDKIVFEQLSRYTYSVLEYRAKPGGTISRKYNLSPSEQAMLAANATVLRGFGMRTGVAHVEFFLRDDDRTVVFGEAAARAGGGSIVPAIDAGSGINLAGEWCRLELDPGHVVTVRPGPETGTEYLSSDQYGRIVNITSADELMALDSVLDASVWKQVGDVLAEPVASNDVLGWYVCAGTGFDDIRQRFAQIRSAFQVQTEQA